MASGWPVSAIMWLVINIGAYLAALGAVAAVIFFVVIFLSGPHAGLLPHGAEVMGLAAGRFVVLVLPVVLARAVWCITGRQRAAERPIRG